MSKKTTSLFWLFGLALTGALAFWAYTQWQNAQPVSSEGSAKGKSVEKGSDKPGDKGSGKGAGRGGGPAPVAVGQATKGNVNVYINGLGTAIPLRTVTVRSRVDGQLMRVHFKEGQIVKEGDLLVEIDPRPFQAQVLQAEGQIQRDQALLGNARIDLERYRKLLKQDAISEQQVATQESLVQQLEGSVKIDQGVVENARLQLMYAKVTAPISGVLGLRLVDQGNVVRANDAAGLVVITQIKPMTILFPIPQDSVQPLLTRLHQAAKIPVDIFDREDKIKLDSGALLTVDNQIDTTTGTVKLRAQTPNDKGLLFPNQFVNVRMLVDTRTNRVTVPSAAIQRGAEGLFVYVIKEDKSLSMRPVKTGVAEGSRVVIESGVEAGERVVVDGMDRLRDGMKVEVIDVKNRGEGKREGKGEGKGPKGRNEDLSAGPSGVDKTKTGPSTEPDTAAPRHKHGARPTGDSPEVVKEGGEKGGKKEWQGRRRKDKDAE